jgi:hypothetical protein
LTDLRSNNGTDNSVYRSRKRLNSKKKSKNKKITSRTQNKANEKDVLDMFKNYRIKCPSEDEKYDKGSVKYINQQYCKEVQAEHLDINSKRASFKGKKMPTTYPSRVALKLYPKQTRIPKFCSTADNDDSKASRLCQKIKARADAYEDVPKNIPSGLDFGSTFNSKRERKIRIPSNVYNPR